MTRKCWWDSRKGGIQSHVVIKRQPANNDRRFRLLKGLLDHPLVMQKVGVSDDHAFRLAGRPGRVLEKGGSIACQRRETAFLCDCVFEIVRCHPFQIFQVWKLLAEGLNSIANE
jgi:hypothetical protein